MHTSVPLDRLHIKTQSSLARGSTEPFTLANEELLLADRSARSQLLHHAQQRAHDQL